MNGEFLNELDFILIFLLQYVSGLNSTYKSSLI